MTEHDGTFGVRVFDAFIERVEAGPLPMERIPFEGRGFIRDVRGHYCYWLSLDGFVEHATIRTDVLEAPRSQLQYNIYDLEPVDENRLVSVATDLLWGDHEMRMAALAAVARIDGTEVGPANTRLFAFGGLLSKSWTEEGAVGERRFEAGRLDVGAVVRGKALVPAPG